MRCTATIVAGLAAVAIASGSAFAADPVIIIPPPAPAPPPAATGFNWTGPYLGVYAGREAQLGPFAWEDWMLGGQVGFNLVRGPLLVGVELRAGVLLDGTDAEFQGVLAARLGAILRDQLVLYAKLGLAVEELPMGDRGLFAVGGVEFGIGRALSLFLEAGIIREVGEDPDAIFLAGLNWHPGN